MKPYWENPRYLELRARTRIDEDKYFAIYGDEIGKHRFAFWMSELKQDLFKDPLSKKEIEEMLSLMRPYWKSKGQPLKVDE